MKLKLLLFFFTLIPFLGIGQINVSGVVKDSVTQQLIPFAKIRFKEGNTITLTDENGKFKLASKSTVDTLIIDFVGYKVKYVPLEKGKFNDLTIFLSENITSLNTIVVEAGENPAFEILRKVQKNKRYNNPDKLLAYECEVYNKMQFDVNNMSDKFKNRKIFTKFDFIMDYMNSIEGENYLPILLSESLSNYYYKKSPKQKKEVINATRITGIKNLQLEQFTGDLYQKVNLYNDYVELFNKAFLSPIAGEGKIFYKYYLLENDTLDNAPCYHIKFVPKLKGDLVFDGEIWINSNNYGVKKVNASIPDDVNLNYVSDFSVVQDFSQVDSGVYLVTDEDVKANFDLFNEYDSLKLMGVTIHKHTYRSDFVLNTPRDFDFYVADLIVTDSAKIREETYWNENRHDNLSEEEQGVIDMVDSLKNNKTYRFYEKLAYLSYTGFWIAGPVEIGHIFTAYNRNIVEGRSGILSLRTSNNFSKKVEFSAFVGYGLLDRRWKYGGSVRWKIKDRPRELLRFAYRKRIDQLGIIPTVGDVGNSFSSFLSSAPIDKLTFVDLASIDFEKDWNFDMRTFNRIEWKRFVPLGISDYSRIDPETGDTNQIASLTSFQIRNQIIYTKDEKFLKGQFQRTSLGSKYPIVSLTHTWGIKDVLQSDYSFHRLDLIWNHRPRVGRLGRLDYTVHAGKIFGQVPYPFLQIHQGNQSFYLQKSGFNLMNVYEFVSDQFVRVLFEHHFQGLIMDRVPLIRKLKWRLLYTAKGVIGSYSDKHNNELLLPFYSSRLTRPYYEVGVGLENIFKFIRVDAIWRLSYRDNLDSFGQAVSNFGVKFIFTSDF